MQPTDLCTYIADDGDEGEELEDVVPSADILRLEGCRSLVVLHQLEGVQTQLNDVVDESAQGSQRKRSHEDRHEPELDHCRRHTVSVILLLSLTNLRLHLSVCL